MNCDISVEGWTRITISINLKQAWPMPLVLRHTPWPPDEDSVDINLDGHASVRVQHTESLVEVCTGGGIRRHIGQLRFRSK